MLRPAAISWCQIIEFRSDGGCSALGRAAWFTAEAIRTFREMRTMVVPARFPARRAVRRVRVAAVVVVVAVVVAVVVVVVVAVVVVVVAVVAVAVVATTTAKTLFGAMTTKRA